MQFEELLNSKLSTSTGTFFCTAMVHDGHCRSRRAESHYCLLLGQYPGGCVGVKLTSRVCVISNFLLSHRVCLDCFWLDWTQYGKHSLVSSDLTPVTSPNTPTAWQGASKLLCSSRDFLAREVALLERGHLQASAAAISLFLVLRWLRPAGPAHCQVTGMGNKRASRAIWICLWKGRREKTKTHYHLN